MFLRSMNPLLNFSTELTYLGDLENPGQLPVQQVHGGTDDCVSRSIFIIHVYVFEVQESIFDIPVLNYQVQVTSEIQVRESLADIPTELSCLRDLENTKTSGSRGFRGHSSKVAL